MTTSDSSPTPTGRWQRRVRALTAGAVGAAVLAAAGVTVTLATGQDAAAGPTTSTSSSGPADGAAGPDASTGSRSGTGTGSTGSTGTLTPPAESPSHSSGRGHAMTGGS